VELFIRLFDLVSRNGRMENNVLLPNDLGQLFTFAYIRCS